MSKPEFVYTTYIETTAEEVWHALTEGDFTERYWFGHRINSEWKVRSAHRVVGQGKPSIEGKVLEADPPRRLAHSSDPCSPDGRRERTSRVTFDIEPRRKVAKLTVRHDNLEEGGKTLRDISGGWLVMASLKSFPETGREPPHDLAQAVKEQACG